MFTLNKYTKWYYAIVDRAKIRINDGYTENHHIIPKSLCGSNTKDNKVDLNAREHFICHLLLTKMPVYDYFPYMPVVMVKAVDPNTFQPTIWFKTRYGTAPTGSKLLQQTA